MVIAPFALVALAGAAIAGLLIWAAQRLFAGRHASFDNCFITAFLGIFAIAVGAFVVALVITLAGHIWPAAADLAHGVDMEMTRGALPYAITCLGGQAIALVAVPVGLLAGFALYRAI